MQSSSQKSKVLVFVVAYRAEPFIKDVLTRTLKTLQLSPNFDSSLLIIDDASSDATVRVARDTLASCPLPWEVLRTPHNLGYGGNQKLGYSYAIANGFDHVVLLHGDGQYAPEYLPAMLAPLIDGTADLVLGSRFLNPRDALKGGMPLHKFCGNRALTWIQNRLLHTNLAEFHTGLRAWRVSSLARLPFPRNNDGFSFDTEILIQAADQGLRFKEIPIRTHYGEEVSHVNTVRYSGEVLAATFRSRLQHLRAAQSDRFSYTPSFSHPDPMRMAMIEAMQSTARNAA